MTDDETTRWTTCLECGHAKKERDMLFLDGHRPVCRPCASQRGYVSMATRQPITTDDVLTAPVPLRVKATAPFRFRFPFMTDPELHEALNTTTDPIEAIVLAAYDFIQWDATYEGGGMTGVQEGLRRSKQRLREAVDRARRRP